jgi:carbamoyltransferase
LIILSICPTHDAAVTILRNGEVLLNLELERYTRVKNDYGFNEDFIRHCLDMTGLKITDVDLVAMIGSDALFDDDDRSGKFDISPYPVPTPSSPNDVVKFTCRMLGRRFPAMVVHHHMAHASAAYLTSPFERAAVLTIDGHGDGLSLTVSAGIDGRVEMVSGKFMGGDNWPLNWAAYCWNNYRMPRTDADRLPYLLPGAGPGKIMALAAYGRSDENIRREIRADSMLRDARSFAGPPAGPEAGGFAHPHKFLWSFNNFEDLSDSRSERSQDFACALQECTEAHLVDMFQAARDILARRGFSSDNICYGGGLALNCIATTRAMERTDFKRLHVPPCPNDCGLALGAGLYAYSRVSGRGRVARALSPYTGPSYPAEVVQAAADAAVAAIPGLTVRPIDADGVADLLIDGDILAMWRNRSECGPRALGHRSILARTDLPDLRERLNRIKQREWYRPFAPIILAAAAAEVLENPVDHSYYMTTSAVIAAPWRERMAGVSHVDHTTRPQILTKENEPFIHAVIDKVHRATGIPAILNTSFNLSEPIVETPEQAVATYSKMSIRHLVLENVILSKPLDG